MSHLIEKSIMEAVKDLIQSVRCGLDRKKWIWPAKIQM